MKGIDDMLKIGPSGPWNGRVTYFFDWTKTVFEHFRWLGVFFTLGLESVTVDRCLCS